MRILAKLLISSKYAIRNLIAKIGNKNNMEIEFLRKTLSDLLISVAPIGQYFSIKETQQLIKTETDIIGLHRLLTIFLYIEFSERWLQKF